MLFAQFSAIVFVAVAATTVSAKPVASPPARRDACTPNFEGVGLAVSNFGASSPAALAPIVSSSFRGYGAADWHFEQNGQPATGFIIKDFDDNNLAVSAREDNSILLDVSSDSGDVVDQTWTVTCNACGADVSQQAPGTVVASSCIIGSPVLNGCVVVGPDTSSPAWVTTNFGECSYFDFSVGY
ncbi:hypothetical protein CYLTODRAFT_441704 [Cylindrobasidium torrendii FP15055 ss-10]|uniref:Ricin B lectin domain-containing protein n=1 Tax=Cylindrobasidium torrendii FP15055 ss-10 TaxID=1314674 RepID=A0A0D7BKV8_9AGAR|nr:hypothetical protein CYLTODRAFT_441704 [Cylindrobasidium torrendii FP15055 ss-10]